jgi:Protein of unknown function (DUF1091)
VLLQVDLTIERVVFSNKTSKAVVDLEKLVLKKINRTHKVITGSLTFLKDIDNDYEVSIGIVFQVLKNLPFSFLRFQLGAEIYKLEGNEYRKTAFKIPNKKICDWLAADIYFYPSIVASSDLPPPNTCPIPAGTYTFDNYFLDASTIPPNFNGRYRFRLMERHLGELIDEANSYVEIQHYVM